MGASIGQRWPGGIVPYSTHPSFTEIDTLNAAIRALEGNTSLRFVKRQSINDSYVVVRNHSANCMSNVGRIGGRQFVGCAPFGFGVAALIHELCHAVGMIHEHQRSDRSCCVAINTSNVTPAGRGNFRRQPSSRNHTSYDLDSIMHYGPFAFSNGGGPTIVANNGTTDFGQAVWLSELDRWALDAEYPHFGIVRRGDSAKGAGEIRELAAASTRQPGGVVTAVRTAKGNLKLIQWRVNDRGAVQRVADSGRAGGPASHIDVARSPGSDRFVTVSRDANSRMSLTWWTTSGGVLQPQGSGVSAMRPTQNQIIALTDTVFLTAARSSRGTLRLTSWRLGNDGSIRSIGGSGRAAGAVKEISLTRVRRVRSDHIVATTVRTRSGRLKVIAWRVSSSNGRIERAGDSGNAIGEATNVASAASHPGVLAVSCRTSNGTLKVIALSISATGQSVVRRGDSGTSAGAIGRNALLASAGGMISAVSTQKSNLKLIRWSVTQNGNVARSGDSGVQAGRVGLLSIADTSVTDAPIVTPVQTASGGMQVVTWDDSSSAGELTR